jgi:tetratricopeptide (TPR) repeat protein
MKQVPLEKYSVAWFKLAECVSRREKERALGVYRLLSHSIDDQAFKYQLEADLLLAFNDTPQAVEKYLLAIESYKQTDRLFEMAALYNHLVTLEPNKHEHLTQLVVVYHALKLESKVFRYIESALDLLVKDTNPMALPQFLSSVKILNEVYGEYAAEYIAPKKNEQ